MKDLNDEINLTHDWDDQDKCRRCGDRDWYASATCTPKQEKTAPATVLLTTTPAKPLDDGLSGDALC